jgi:hypothetical protein
MNEETISTLVSAEIGTLALMVVLGVLFLVWRSRVEARADVTPDLIRLIQQKEESLHALTSRAREDAKAAAAAAAAEHKAYMDALAKLSSNIEAQNAQIVAIRTDIHSSLEAQSLLANDRHIEVLAALNRILAIVEKRDRKRRPSIALNRIQSDVEFIKKVVDNAKAFPQHLIHSAHQLYGASAMELSASSIAAGGNIGGDHAAGGDHANRDAGSRNATSAAGDHVREDNQRADAHHRGPHRRDGASRRRSNSRKHRNNQASA